MRLAFFSPFNPQPSGISDYSEELLPYLAVHAELDLYYDGPPPTNQQLVERFNIYPIADFPARRAERRYDTCLYQMGNSCYHQAIYSLLRQYPGITVLHEHVLHHFFADRAANTNDWTGYWRELVYNNGSGFKKYFPAELPASPTDLPLARRVIEASLGIIVHNQDMVQRVLADVPQARVALVPMGMPLPTQIATTKEQIDLRYRLNLPTDAYIVGVFGHLSSHKRIGVILKAFAWLHQQCPEAICLIVGKNTGPTDLGALLPEFGLDSEAVRLTGFVDSTAFSDYIQAINVGVNLRYPVCGETSAAALRLMAYGKPLIVSDVATFAGIPDDACVRVAVNAAETELLYRYLLLLAQQPELLHQLGHNAWRYVQQQHALANVAQQMATAIHNILTAVEKGTRNI